MISAVELRAALGADAALQARINSIHAACTARINRYSPGAPDGVKTESLILYSRRGSIRAGRNRDPCFPLTVEGLPVNVSRAFLLSGAQSLLSSWRVPRAGACR